MKNYFKILFKHDPKKPLNSFWLHLVMLRMVGLWTPENKLWKPAYRIYSNFCAIVWVLFFLCTQAYFFMNVTSIPDVADALFFFLNELMLLPKIYYYRKNATLMKKIVAKLESENFLPKNKDEEKYVRKTMAHTTFNHRYLIANTYVVILNWAFSAYFNHKNNTGNKFLMPARFPFNTDGKLYWIAFFYQFFAIYYTGTIHMTTDTFATGLIFHAGYILILNLIQF
uniref:CSON005362 protein n=1 Tax=Culicoides sonorensis TaxID=179676 RepID=A0A336N2W0_CULSO